MNPFFRALVALLALSAVVAGAIFYLGGKQIEYVAEIRIDGTAEEVMEHLTNPELSAEWAVGFEDMDKRSDEQGNVNEAEISVQLDGEEPEMVAQLVTMVADSDTSLSVNHKSREFDAVSAWQIVPQNRGVRLRQLLLANHKGMGRMTALFNRGVVEQQLQQDLTRLKSLIETGKVPPLPSESPAETKQPSAPMKKAGPDAEAETDASDSEKESTKKKAIEKSA